MSKSTTPSLLALSCVGAIAFATAAHSQENEQGRKLGGMTVTDTAIDEKPVKVDRPDSPKYTAPLVDTPQTITVISRASLDQQNLLTLREVLSTVPGITFGAGEAGNGYGDRITLMGQDAKNDVTVDGVRSGAVTSRNETYNIEQVEVTTGANSAQSGGGSVAGTINLVTKRPLATNITTIQGGVGTDNYFRGTVDINRRVNELVAVRLNAVYHQNDVPGRDSEYYDRWGVSPSITIGIDSPTNLTVQFDHLTDHSMPQYGARWFPRYGGFLPGQNLHSYYGTRNVDHQNSDTDSIQAIFSHEFSDTLRIRNLTRYEDIQQDTITSNIGGSFCVADGTATGLNPAAQITAATSACTALVTGSTTQLVPPGYYQPTGSRGVQRFIRNETAYNQFDVIGTLNTGGIEHSFVLGASVLWQKYRQDQGNVLRNADGTATGAAALPIVNFANPNEVVPLAGYNVGSNIYTGPINYIHGSQANGRQTSYSAYFFDTAKITDWLQINGGIRYDHVEGQNFSYSFNTTNAVGAPLGDVTAATARAAENPNRLKNDLVSYRIGIVAKPTPNTTLYVAYGNSKLPSQSSVNDSCSQTVAPGGTGTAAAGSCNTSPQVTKNYEIGAKAELFNKRLLVTGALFRNDRNYNVTPSGTVGSADLVSDGKQRSQGVSFGLSGNVTDAWTISANYMYLDAYTIQSLNDAATAAGTFDPIAGSPNINAPEHSGSVFSTYRLPFGLQVGYGLSYQGSFLMNQYTRVLTGTPAPVYKVPSYVTQRLMLSYPINDTFSAQLNVQNLFNEKYVTTVRTSVGESWAVPGPSRSAVFSVTGKF